MAVNDAHGDGSADGVDVGVDLVAVPALVLAREELEDAPARLPGEGLVAGRGLAVARRRRRGRILPPPAAQHTVDEHIAQPGPRAQH